MDHQRHESARAGEPPEPPSDPGGATPRRYVPAVGPRLRRLLAVVLGLFAVMAVNSVYLVAVTVAGTRFQGYFYQWMFLGHLLLGLAITAPVVVFGVLHSRNARRRPNRRAIRAGYALFAAALALLATGFVLLRLDVAGIRLEVNDPFARSAAYWVHVVSPVVAIWLFVLHRLAGRRIRWRTGLGWAALATVFAVGMLLVQRQDPRAWNVVGPASGERYFAPSLARTSSGNFIPEHVLANDQYCKECHEDVHRGWAHSVHRFSSFNNPPYLFSVQNTRRKLMERDGSVRASRFCAGCHDPVPFFTGAFDDPRFDDPEYDLAADPTAQAGITCTVCHAISNINSVRGNADYTIDEPVHYPFTFSERPLLRWINRQLVKAKPEFHKATFLKPLHREPEFCGTCHKVHLPEELNGYKWLRGQNHYDSFWLSGVSGQGVESFYYPALAETDCNGCHMPLRASEDFAAGAFETDPDAPLFGRNAIHDHQFPSANTAIPHLLGMPSWVNDAHRAFVADICRLDIFGLREGGRIDGELAAPLRPAVPTLARGGSYLLDVVIRTLKLGHLLTEGTADSNELWLELTVRSGDRVIAASGDRAADGTVDPWAHFVNAFVIDREGRRIDRRNAEDIFVSLYNHQIPPGAADVVHYRLDVPADAGDAITVEARLLYRKFDTTYMRLVQGEDFDGNDLPVMTLAEDRLTLPVGPAAAPVDNEPVAVPAWERWNDYGIGLLRKGERGELRGAERAFTEVERCGRPDGPLNLARVYLKEGRVTDAAPAALQRAAAFDPPAPEWTLLWLAGLVDKQNGRLDAAVDRFRQIVEGGFAQAAGRGFDFSRDYRLLNELASTTYLQSKQQRGAARRAQREALLRDAEGWYRRVLELDPENVAA
ncbi:MAG: multiheme c-type cytochrome, partial [Planctomycetota bacterium]